MSLARADVADSFPVLRRCTERPSEYGTLRWVVPLPTIHEEAGFRFGFVMADRRERPHIHAVGHGGHAKVWLDTLDVARTYGLRDSDIRRVLAIVGQQRVKMLMVWREVFGE